MASLSPQWHEFETFNILGQDPIWILMLNWFSFFISRFNVELDVDLAGDEIGPWDGVDLYYTIARESFTGKSADLQRINCSSTFRDPTQVLTASPSAY